MPKDKNINNQYLTRSDIERHLKSNKNLMNSMSAAEFESYIDGAMWMMTEKQNYIERLKDRLKNDSDKILELQNELAPYRELYEDYEFVEKRGKKSKKTIILPALDDDDDDIMSFQEDDYSDINGEDFDD